MLIIRPVAESDLDDLVELASMASFGLTSLPRDRELLADRIAISSRNFQTEHRKPGENSISLLWKTWTPPN